MLWEALMGAGTRGRLLAAAALAAVLAGCVDVTADINVKTPDTATAQLTETVAAQFYPMIKAARQSGSRKSDAVDSFCRTGTLTENADGSATCMEKREGTFQKLGFDAMHGPDAITFKRTENGTVRVSLSTRAIAQHLTWHAASGPSDEDIDARRQMLVAYFQGRTLTFRVSGAAIVDTNMTLAPDGQAAAVTVPFDDIIQGKADVPPTLYATVDPESDQ